MQLSSPAIGSSYEYLRVRGQLHVEPDVPALAEDRMKVVTTFTVIADMARNVAGDAAEVVSITRPGAEIHGYQPTPRDIVGALDADLVLWNGRNLELWVEQFLANKK